MNYKEIEGDLIALAKAGDFDVIAHGCNCFCKMKKGLAPQMADAFGNGYFNLESPKYEGDINKLGQIDYERIVYNTLLQRRLAGYTNLTNGLKIFYSVNCYTQYDWRGEKNLDYLALRLCLRKMNHVFKGKHIGLPQIGCGLAGGDFERVRELIKIELKDCDVTVVIKK